MGYTERKRWLFFGLPFTFTKYVVGEDVLTIQTGFFTTKENDCYMYKIQDVEWEQTLLERIFGLGTVVCFTGDVTHPQLRLEHIKNSKTLKKVATEIPLEHIVIETDCPYLAPTPYRGKRNSSAYLPMVVEEIARLRGISPEEVERVTYENAMRLYSIAE